MSRIVDNLVAYRILSMLVTPFEDTAAFKLGIIDKTGTNLKRFSTLKTSEERNAYTYLHRLVFNMKKIVNKIGGENRLKSLVAALWMVKEYYQSDARTVSLMEGRYVELLSALDKVTLAEEEIMVSNFLMEEEGGPPVNNTSGASVNEPKIYPQNARKYKAIARRLKDASATKTPKE
jgi:hypothetical protein